MTARVALQAESLSRRLGTRAVLDGVSLALARGRWASLLGPSGSGKTTLLQIAGLLDRPDGGRVLVDGVDAWELDDDRRTDLRLSTFGFVFQNRNLIDHLPVRDNVALPHWHLGGSRRRAMIAADGWLERLGLRDRAAALAAQLSPGEAQRAAVARALINRPAIVLADEPTGSLDAGAGRAVLDALGEVCASGAALLVVTHEPDIAARGDVMRLQDGRVIHGG